MQLFVNITSTLSKNTKLTLIGKGQYIYTEASVPVRPGSMAVLKGPVMIGIKCLTFNYHMKGNNVGGLLVNTTCARGDNTQQLLWVKSGNRGDKWFQAHVNVDKSCHYQVCNSIR